ncbi:MAG: chemotaxis-specific protein-glutamate methyltransferase CheB [Candidatus Dadabacteria bacterium]|nr:MAG: chemotaxis-specific protein-glutamate methyltransferase CheB [Candidatus Dadabacteria bacterium]
MTGADRKLRILIVDDSAYSRRALRQMLADLLPGATFLTASAGDEGLQMAFREQPDLIFLDLEMPRMDGFTFLRLLMARQPTPVLVVSGQNDEANVLKALDLGALDFVSKPTRTASTRIWEIEDQLRNKIQLLDLPRLHLRKTAPAPPAFQAPREIHKALPEVYEAPRQLICIGSSTGGPGTVSEILENVTLEPWASIVICQHMPPGFTRAFAERLDRTLPFPVREIQDLDRVSAGTAFVCPGGANTTLSRGRELRWQVRPASPDDRYVPAIDRLFESAAQEFGPQTLAVVITGMGNDGTAGARVVREAGGTVAAEDPASAIVFGMPQSIVEADLADHVYTAATMGGFLEQWMRGLAGPRKPPSS